MKTPTEVIEKMATQQILAGICHLEIILATHQQKETINRNNRNLSTNEILTTNPRHQDVKSGVSLFTHSSGIRNIRK